MNAENKQEAVKLEKRICMECGHVEDVKIDESKHYILKTLMVCSVLLLLFSGLCWFVAGSLATFGGWSVTSLFVGSFFACLIFGGALTKQNPDCSVCQKKASMIPYDSPEGQNVKKRIEGGCVGKSAVERLEELDKLKRAGVLSESEYEDKRKQIVSEI